jgi:hypothetical protein
MVPVSQAAYEISLPVIRCMRALLQRRGALFIEIGALVDCAGTAYWRREKAIEFPDDVRNLEAARELDRLAVEIAALEGSKLHAQLDKLFEDKEGGLIAMPIDRDADYQRNSASGRLLAVV